MRLKFAFFETRVYLLNMKKFIWRRNIRLQWLDKLICLEFTLIERRHHDTDIDTDNTIPTLIPIQIRIAKYNSKQKNKLEKFEATQELIFFRNMYHRQYKFVFQNKPLVFEAEFCGKRKKGPRPLLNFFSSNCDMTEKRLFGRTVIQKLIYKTFFFEHERTWFNQKKRYFLQKSFLLSL